jgi:hypothetical protein
MYVDILNQISRQTLFKATEYHHLAFYEASQTKDKTFQTHVG